MKIFLAEDDVILNKNITEALHAENYQVVSVSSGFAAERWLRKEPFDLLILDVGLPEINGFELCRFVRSRNQEVPVLFLTAYAHLEDKIRGYESGCDDYLTKPFFMRELLLRVQALLRRHESAGSAGLRTEPVRQFEDIRVDYRTKEVWRGGTRINLTPREFHLLWCLIKNPGEVVSKQQLVREVWGSAIEAGTNLAEVYINFLRNKIDKPFNKNTIRTRVGYGYYLGTD